MAVLQTALRWLAGTLVVVVVVAVGVVARTVVVGHQDQRAAADAIVVLGAAQYDGRPSAGVPGPPGPCPAAVSVEGRRRTS